MRSELDAKLKELYVTDDSLAYEQQRIFDGTIYTSLIWTVLATTTLFYVFKKIFFFFFFSKILKEKRKNKKI